jgi:uncharacterized membrane-anchored protein
MAIPLHDNSKKNLTKALLKNEYIEAMVTSVNIEHNANELMRINLELVIPEVTAEQIGGLVNGNSYKIAIVKI